MPPLILFSLSTNECSVFDNCIIKYADDTVITRMILNDDHRNYRTQIQNFIEWSKLKLSIVNLKRPKKLKQILGDSSKVFHIGVESVERVS